MNEEELKSVTKIENPKRIEEEKPKEIYKPEEPKATAPPIEPKKPPETTSGIDVTANMDDDQKKTFKEIQDKAQVIPQMVDTQRPFCQRMKAIKERRATRRARG